MTIDFFLFCITVTLVTFTTICIFAMSNPGYPRRSYGAGNWGGYDKSQSQKAELISLPSPSCLLSTTTQRKSVNEAEPLASASREL
jgi:hypothetical protein